VGHFVRAPDDDPVRHLKIAKLFGAKMDVTDFRENPFPTFEKCEPPAMP